MFRIEIVGTRQQIRGVVSEAIENFLAEMGYRTANAVSFYRGATATHYVDWCVDGLTGTDDERYGKIVTFLESMRLNKEHLNWRHYEIPSSTI